MQPMNYTIDTGNAGNSFAQGFQNTSGMLATAADYQRAQQMATIAQQKADAEQYKRQRFMQAAQNPTSKEVQKLLLEFPELHEGLGKSMDFMSAEEKKNTQAMSFSVLSALEKGSSETAIGVIDRQIDAAKQSKNQEQLQRLEILRDSVMASPDGARFGLKGLLFSTMGKDYGDLMKNLGENDREAELQPALVEKGKADAESAKVTARYADATAQQGLAKTGAEVADKNSAISDRAARLGLDRDKFNLDFDAKLAELQGKTAVTLSPGMEKLQADSVTKSLSSADLANKAETLAGAMEKAGQFGGAWSWVTSKSADVLGADFDVNALRREYISLRNKGVIDGLPPGTATEKDIELIKAGFPSENADSSTISKWLRSFSNVQKAAAKREEAQAEWIANVGSLSNARRDIDVGGVKVPAGTSFADFIKRSNAGGAPAKADLNYFMQKYAK